MIFSSRWFFCLLLMLLPLLLRAEEYTYNLENVFIQNMHLMFPDVDEKLLKRGLQTYTGGKITEFYQLVDLVTRDLESLLPDTYKYFNVEIDYLIDSMTGLPQPGLSIVVAASKEMPPRAELFAEIYFHCVGQYHVQRTLVPEISRERPQFVRGVPSLVKSGLDIAAFERKERTCMPTVEFEHLSLTKELRSRGIAPLLIANLADLLGMIKLPGQEPDINIYAFTNSERGYTGAHYWARAGFQIDSSDEMARLSYNFIEWLFHAQPAWWKLKFSFGAINERTDPVAKAIIQAKQARTPGDLLKIYGGREFLKYSESIGWRGKMLVSPRDKGYKEFRQKFERMRIRKPVPMHRSFKRPVTGRLNTASTAVKPALVRL